jgi:hypothetical protein
MMDGIQAETRMLRKIEKIFMEIKGYSLNNI